MKFYIGNRLIPADFTAIFKVMPHIELTSLEAMQNLERGLAPYHSHYFDFVERNLSDAEDGGFEKVLNAIRKMNITPILEGAAELPTAEEAENPRLLAARLLGPFYGGWPAPRHKEEEKKEPRELSSMASAGPSQASRSLSSSSSTQGGALADERPVSPQIKAPETASLPFPCASPLVESGSFIAPPCLLEIRGDKVQINLVNETLQNVISISIKTQSERDCSVSVIRWSPVDSGDTSFVCRPQAKKLEDIFPTVLGTWLKGNPEARKLIDQFRKELEKRMPSGQSPEQQAIARFYRELLNVLPG
jgi:hypothetical protein